MVETVNKIEMDDCATDYPAEMAGAFAVAGYVAILDPLNGVAVNLDQGNSGTCVRFSLAACIYE
jgi:hypothetical protein